MTNNQKYNLFLDAVRIIRSLADVFEAIADTYRDATVVEADANCSIVAHVHDELIIEADRRMSLSAVCEQMGRTPPWAKGLLLRADGYECDFYKKD